ncbi:MAG TPA: CPBP family intramembrane metalloprotease [Candidatus Wallbacteria bacterium]|nr:CPBP family intramembrane metalloprotease [Candidatus Wallbacteria bacterium]
MAKNKYFIFLIYLSMILPFAASFFYFIIMAGTPQAKIVYSLTKFFMLFMAFIVYTRYFGSGFREVKGWPQHFSAKNISSGLTYGILIGAFILAAYEYYFAPRISPMAFKIREQCLAFGIDTPFKYIAMTLLISLVNSLFEEIFWRWMLIDMLTAAHGKTAAAFLAAAGFSLHHYVVVYRYFGIAISAIFGTAVMAAGLIWGLMYLRSSSIVSPWISHIIADFFILYIGYRMAF